jgi:hypothetical protein
MPRLAGFAVARNRDGGLEIVAVVRDVPSEGTTESSEVWSVRQVPGTTAWSRESLGGPPSGDLSGIAIAPNYDGRLESVVVSQRHAVWHAWQTPGGDWSGWKSLESPGDITIFDPVLTQDKDGRLEVFTNGLDGKTWHRRQPQPGLGPWEGWQPLDRPVTAAGFSEPPAVARNHPGRLEVFAVASPLQSMNANRELWHRWQSDSGSDWPTAWAPLGTPGAEVGVGSPVLVRTKDGWLGVLTIVGDKAIWHRRQRGSGAWQPWMPFASHPGWLTELAAGVQADERLVLLTIGRRPDGRTELWLGQGEDRAWEQATWKLLETGGLGFAGPTATINSPALLSDSQGRLQLFCQVGADDPDRQTCFYIRGQQEPNSDNWELEEILNLRNIALQPGARAGP